MAAKPPRARRSSVALYTEVAEHSEFSTSEVRSLFREFRAIANQGKLNRQQFRDAIGILGTFRDSVIPDRLFDAFDLDRDGMIDASEYVAGMSVMTRGSDAEKLALSWRMADLDNSGSVTVEEVHIIMESYHRVLASLGLRTGVGTCIWRSDVAQLFTELENGDEIAKDAYARAMSGLDVVEWLRAHERYGPDEGTPEGQAAAQAAAAAADTRGRRVTYVLDGEERASLRAAPEAAEAAEEEETGEVTEDELMAMSVKALKTMFAKRKVSLTGCFEKTDMRAKARSAGLVIAEPEEPPAAEDEDEESKDGGAAAAAAGGGGGGGGGGGDPINGGLSDEEEEGGVGGGGDESEEGKVAALSLEETLRKLQEGVMECLGVADALTAQLKDKQAAADAEELAALAAEAVQAEHDGAAAAAAAAAPADDAAAAGDSAEAAATRPAAESAAAAAVVASAVGVEANGFSSLDDAKESVASMEAKLATLLTLIARADTIVAEGGVPAQPATTEASLAGLEATAAPAPPLLKSFTKVQLAVPRASTVGTTPATRNKHIGDPVGFIHRSWDLVMNVMLGVRLAVGRVASDAGREITPTDFKQHDRYTLSASAGAQSDAVSAMKTATNSKQMKAKGKELPPYVFIDHCPQVFHQLRLMLGIDTDEYMKSVGPESLLSNLFTGSLSSLSELVSEGKSGSFFYFTHDGRYMVKTLREGEKHALAEILPDYFYHMQRNPDSMLTRFLGMHELHKRDMNKPKEAPQKYYFVVMQSVFLTKREIHEQFDLKGSWLKRLTDPEKRRGQTLKDLDWCKPDIDDSWAGRFGVPFSKTAEATRLIEHPQRKIELGPERREMFMAQVRKDVGFLERHQIIDYSLLLGIHQPHGKSIAGTANPMAGDRASFHGRADLSADDLVSRKKDDTGRDVPFFQRDFGGMRALDSTNTYYVGVIDILIQFGAKKRMEHKWKAVRTPSKNARGEHGISVVPPEEYAARFINFMDTITQ